MSKAWELYNDSYIKGMKRPEYWGFKPDDASGSSMLFRSEETNPWANRDQSNAKFGALGGANNNSVIRGQGGGGGAQLNNIPFAPNAGRSSADQNTFANLLKMGGGMAVNKGMNYGMKKGVDAIKDLLGYGPKASVDVGAGMGADAAGFAADRAFDAEAGIEGASGAASGIPFAGPALKLGLDAATGKLMKSPGKSLGGAGGTLAGAAIGQAAIPIPGVGAAIGAVLGGLGGSTLGGLFGGKKSTPPAPGMPDVKLQDLVKLGEGEGTRVIEDNDLWEQLMGSQDYGSIDDYLSQDWSMWD